MSALIKILLLLLFAATLSLYYYSRTLLLVLDVSEQQFGVFKLELAKIQRSYLDTKALFESIEPEEESDLSAYAGVEREDFIVAAIRLLEKKAAAAGLSNSSFNLVQGSPAVASQENLIAMPATIAERIDFEITGTGHYENIVDFLRKIENIPAAAGAIRLTKNGNYTVHVSLWRLL